MSDASASDSSKLASSIAQLSLTEKISLLHGDLAFWPGLAMMLAGAYSKKTWNAPGQTQLNYSGIRFADGPRGIVLEGCTTFPVAMARGASWNPELEKRIGAVVGRELRVLGGNLYGGVCINLVRHPAWGRAQESFGEDPFHLAQFAIAATQGVQQQVMACVKHYALNSMENARFSVDVKISMRALHEVYLPHFKAAFDAGAECAMSAYNAVNGDWCGHSKNLLTDILKQRWGFQGFVISDFIFGIRDSAQALNAGMDLEMPFFMHYRQGLAADVHAGRVTMAKIDDAVSRLVNSSARQIARSQAMPNATVVGCEDHRALALESARQGIVLLKNESTLPLIKPKRIAVIGHLAAVVNTGDRGSSNTRPEYVTTPLEGIRQQAPADCIVDYDDGSDVARAIELARNADFVLVVAGYTFEDEGEFISPDSSTNLRKLFPKPKSLSDAWSAFKVWRGLSVNKKNNDAFAAGGDRERLNLRANDEALILALADALVIQPKTKLAVAVIAGSAVVMEAWRHRVQSILMLWYPGMEGGTALGEIIFGKVNPSGRLPLAFASDPKHLPFFDRNADTIEYDLYHGYRHLDRQGVRAAFPFGFGLSYSHFELSAVQLAVSNKHLRLQVHVHNRSQRDGTCVVQVYLKVFNSKVERVAKELKGFARVDVKAEQNESAEIMVSLDCLRYFSEAVDDFVLEPANYALMIAQHADDESALHTNFHIDAQGQAHVE
jgi:beta-glucosidase